MMVFGVMGNLYAWATPEYMLNNMSLEEIYAYIKVHCPEPKEEKRTSSEELQRLYPKAYKRKES
jgi:hypothetical protein